MTTLVIVDHKAILCDDRIVIRSVYPPRPKSKLETLRDDAMSRRIELTKELVPARVNGAADSETGCTALQLRVLALLIAGKPLAVAARQCETSPQTISRWFDEHAPFQKEWKRRCNALRQTAVNSIMSAGAKGLHKLTKLVDHSKVSVQLAASKALVASLTTVARSFQDEQTARVAPIFALPNATSITFDVRPEALPAGPASVVVDATLVKARTLDDLQADGSIVAQETVAHEDKAKVS